MPHILADGEDQIFCQEMDPSHLDGSAGHLQHLLLFYHLPDLFLWVWAIGECHWAGRKLKCWADI